MKWTNRDERKSEENSVSVIMTVYNYNFTRNFEAVVKALKEQSVSLEIILCDQGIEPNQQFKRFCEQSGVLYVHTLPDIKEGKVLYNIGRVRNIGAAVSKGEFLYFNDADILIHNKDFFSLLIEYSKRMNNIALFRPKMRRLSIETSSDFTSDFLEGKTIDFDEDNPICLVKYNKEKSKIELIPEGEFRALRDNLPHVCVRKDYKEAFDYDPKKTAEEQFALWKVSFHYGGTFCSFDTFCDVGGYCEEYYNWGMEDSDFHWKLNGTVGVQSIDDVVMKSSVIHFEHLGRYENQTYRSNREVFKKRINIGLDNAKHMDICRNDTFMANFINQRLDLVRKYFKDMNGFKFRDIKR